MSQKLDMLGIGGSRQADANGIAWKQNKDFENLLKRLNEVSAVDGTDSLSRQAVGDEEVSNQKSDNEKAEKKRKREQHKDSVEPKKKRKKDADGKSHGVSAQRDPPVVAVQPYIPRHRA